MKKMENTILSPLPLIDIYIAYRLTHKRKGLDMGLFEAAYSVGIKGCQLKHYEQAKSKISANLLYKLAGLYKVNLDYFFKDFIDKNNRGL